MKENRMYSVSRMERGFTIVEVAIAVMILAIILGYSVAMFPVQQELKQYRHAEAEMDEIIEQLVAFAQVNGRLPCPDTSTNNELPANTIDGLEDQLNDPFDGCEAYFGFLPARTLGIVGKYNAAGTLIDPWGQGYGYAVSDFDFGNGNPDLVTANGIRDEGISNVDPDLFICDGNDNAPAMDTDCTSVSGTEVLGTFGEVAAVIISPGKDFAATSNIQAENLDDLHDGTNDKVYIFSGRRDDYDDIVKWVPTNLLISRMIAAEQLP